MSTIFAQSKVVFGLQNASFEGLAGQNAEISDWYSCEPRSTPDLLPGPWGVRIKPSQGMSYLGLTTREDRSWEHIEQKLSDTLKKNQCYQFRVDLAHSPVYAGYTGEVCLRVWAGKDACSPKQLLASSAAIGHSDWRTYEFSFFAEADWTYLYVEAYYKPASLFFYKGNLLIDSFSPFETCIKA